MLSYEEAGLVLDELVDELPEGIFENLNGGVSFVEEAVTAEDGRYTLGTYFRNGMGRYIELYTAHLSSFTARWMTSCSDVD